MSRELYWVGQELYWVGQGSAGGPGSAGCAGVILDGPW